MCLRWTRTQEVFVRAAASQLLLDEALSTGTVNNMQSDNNRAYRALNSALAASSGNRFTLLEGPGLRRRTVRVQYGTSESVLAPVWAGEGFPKDVERALDEIAKNPLHPRETLVIAARTLSSGARARLETERISWVDEEGRAAISADPGLVVVREIASREQARTADEMRWSEGTGALAQHLLTTAQDLGNDADRDVLRLGTVADLAREIGVSAPLVSRSLQGFDAQGWTDKVGPERGSASGRVLTDPTGLLSSWAAWHRTRQPETVRSHATFRDAHAFVTDRLLAGWGTDHWALTGWLALENRAPFVTSVPHLTVYVAAELFHDRPTLESWLVRAGARTVDNGARLELVEADPYVLRQVSRVRDAPQVSDVRLYGDLLRLGVRGADAAEHLRETRIGF